MADYQGEKFKTFITKVKANHKDYGFEDRPTNEVLAEKLGVSSVQLNRYYKSKSLERDSVNKITSAFKVTEDEIWGDDLSKSNAKPIEYTSGEPNMWDVTIKAQGGFLEGYGDTVLMEQNVPKVYFPFFKGECFSFEVEGLSMAPDYVTGDKFISTPVENLNHLVKGRVYVFQTIEGIILKEFERIEEDYIYLRSINEDYNPVKPIYLKEIKRVYQREMVIKN